MKFVLLACLLLAPCALSAVAIASENDLPTTSRRAPSASCNLPPQMVQEIKSYAPIANKIIKFVTSGKFKGKTWRKLAEFVDKFGSRIAGSENLENAIDFMLKGLTKEGLENVHGENAQVPHWVRYKHIIKFIKIFFHIFIFKNEKFESPLCLYYLFILCRGREYAELIEPRKQNLPILGLGSSIATPKEGITAELLVVDSFDELQKNKALVYNFIIAQREQS